MEGIKKIIVIFPIIAGAAWGVAGIFVRELASCGFSNITMISVRFDIAVIFLFLIIFVYDKRLFKIKLKDSWVFIAISLMGTLLVNIFYNISVNCLTVSLATVLLAMAPVFTVAISAVVFKERVTVKKIICMLGAMIGCAMVSGVLDQSGVSWSGFGIAMGVLSAVAYGLYGIFSKVAADKGYSVITITFYNLLFTSVILIPFTDWNTIGSYVAISPVSNSVFLLAQTIVTVLISYLTFAIAIDKLDAGLVSIMASSSEPAVAMIVGAVFFAEIPSILSIIGLFVTVMALGILCKQDEPATAEAEELLKTSGTFESAEAESNNKGGDGKCI